MFTCSECGGSLEDFESETYCPDCTRLALFSEVQAADDEAAALSRMPPPDDIPPPADDELPF